MIKFNYENHDDQAHDRRDGDQQIPADETQTSNISASDPGTTKKKRPVSERRVQANRRSALRSTGPRNTERTRFNATKRGFRAQGLTPWDDCEAYKESLEALKSIYASSNPLDLFLMEQTALEIVRTRRMARLEADNVVALSSPPDDSNDPGSEGGAPTVNFAMMKDYAVPVFDLFNRYTTAGTNRLLRYRRELERIPRDGPRPENTVRDIAEDDAIN
jgi:hypothetical protein